MLNFSPEKILLVGIIALLVLGPNRLPQAARTAARLLVDFRKFSRSLQNEMTSALAQPRDALNSAVGDFGFDEIRQSLRGTIDGAVSPLRDGIESAVSPVRDSINGAVGAPSASGARPAGPAPSAGSGEAAVPDDPSLN